MQATFRGGAPRARLRYYSSHVFKITPRLSDQPRRRRIGGRRHARRRAPTRTAQAAADPHWQPARHPQDDWLDQLPGKHRLFFDTTKPDSLEDAIQFSGNFFSANRGDYGLENGDLAVVICMRHRSAPFGYNDAMWARYGVTLAKRAEYTDPKSTDTPKANPFTPVAPPAPARRARPRRRDAARRQTRGLQPVDARHRRA